MKFNNKFYTLIIFLIPFLFLFLSFVPNIYEASLINQLPADRQMVWGEHIYTYDYNVYLSKIRQGAEDRFSVVNKYDNKSDQKGVFLQMVYLLGGKLGGAFKLPYSLIFHFERTVFACCWIMTIIFLSLFFFKKKKYIGLSIIISTLAASFPVIFKLNGKFWIGHYMSWWQEMDILKRISFLPHYLLNYIIITALIILLGLFAKNKKKKYYIIISCVLFFSFFIHPSAGLLFLFSFFIFILITKDYSLCPYFLFLSLLSLVPLLYIKTVTSYPNWIGLVEYDRKYPLPFHFIQYFMAIGPVAVSGFLGLIVVLKKKDIYFLPTAAWVLGALAGLVFFKILPIQSAVRFVQTANQIPLAVLSVYFFKYIFENKNKVFKKIVYLWIVVIIINGIAQSVYSLKSQCDFIHQRIVATLPLVPYPSQVMYPLKDFYNGMVWLEKNTPRNSVVLSKITAGNYIPAYSGNFVYLGHAGETPGFEEKQAKTEAFFSGTMDENLARDFLKFENINYIFYGPQEKDNATQNISRYSFLKPVYKSYYVTIFQYVLPSMLE